MDLVQYYTLDLVILSTLIYNVCNQIYTGYISTEKAGLYYDTSNIFYLCSHFFGVTFAHVLGGWGFSVTLTMKLLIQPWEQHQTRRYRLNDMQTDTQWDSGEFLST